MLYDCGEEISKIKERFDVYISTEDEEKFSEETEEIYYKQIASDGRHTFDDTVKKVVMDNEIKTVEIANPQAPIRNFTLTDASFPSVVIKDGQIILEDN